MLHISKISRTVSKTHVQKYTARKFAVWVSPIQNVIVLEHTVKQLDQ